MQCICMGSVRLTWQGKVRHIAEHTISKLQPPSRIWSDLCKHQMLRSYSLSNLLYLLSLPSKIYTEWLILTINITSRGSCYTKLDYK